MVCKKLKFGRIGWPGLLILLAFWAGAWLQPQPAVRAGVRRVTPTQHFLAGGERALPILSEISATLKQMDARLAKIEKVALTTAKQ